MNGGGDRRRNTAVAHIFVCIKFFRLFVAQASSGHSTRGCDVAMPVLTEAQLTAIHENKRRALERKESVGNRTSLTTAQLQMIDGHRNKALERKRLLEHAKAGCTPTGVAVDEVPALTPQQLIAIGERKRCELERKRRLDETTAGGNPTAAASNTKPQMTPQRLGEQRRTRIGSKTRRAATAERMQNWTA